MFSHVDVQPVPGDGVLHRNEHTVVLVVSTLTTAQSQALSAWARQSPTEPIPIASGVAALGWADDRFHFHAIGPILVTLSTNSGRIEFELGEHEEINASSLASFETVECRKSQQPSETPDPFETLPSGTVPASGFVATVQTPPVIEESDISSTASLTSNSRIADSSTVDTKQELEPQPSESNEKVNPPAPPVTSNDENRPVPPTPPTSPPMPPSVLSTPPIALSEPEGSDDEEAEASKDGSDTTAELSETFVLGIVCSQCESFNHPNATYCRLNAHRLVETSVLQRNRRPTLGHLRLNHNGTHIQLLKTIVLGRAPDVSPLVKRDDAQSVQLEDPSMKLSRSHAVVELRDWSVYLRDDSSQNGTWLIASDGSHTRLSTGEEFELTQETTFSLGQNIVTFFPATFEYLGDHHG